MCHGARRFGARSRTGAEIRERLLSGRHQIGDAVTQLDQVTQQNAALVEESAAAAESLKHQAANLAQTVAAFKLSRHAASAPAPVARAAQAKPITGATALIKAAVIFGRAGLAIPRSTLASWVGQCGVQLQPLVDALKRVMLKSPVPHADETPVAMLKPGNKKTHKAYIWTYCTTSYDAIKAVVFDFAEGRGGQYVRDFLALDDSGPAGWRGKLICDDFSGYKACFELGVTEVGCLAHARRKFHELWANHGSQVGEQALKFFQALYDIERDVQDLQADDRRRIRQEKSHPVAQALHQWLSQQRRLVPNGSATARAIDYSLKRWGALTRYIDDGDLPADNNRVENQIRPIAIGRSNWLFAGSLRAGQRAAAVMSLLHSAKLNGLEPYAYLKDVLTRLPTQPASQIDALLPNRWHPSVRS